MKKIMIAEAEGGWAVRFNDDVPLSLVDKLAVYDYFRAVLWELASFFEEDPEELLK